MISKKELLEKMAEFANKNQGASGAWNSLSFWLSKLPDDQPDLLPFQWPIPDGMEAVSRDGRKVEQLVMMDGITDPLLGVIDGVLHRWNKSGSMGNIHVGNDLFLRRKDRKVWVVEHKSENALMAMYSNQRSHINKWLESNPGAKLYEATLKQVV